LKGSLAADTNGRVKSGAQGIRELFGKLVNAAIGPAVFSGINNGEPNEGLPITIFRSAKKGEERIPEIIAMLEENMKTPYAVIS